VHEQLWGAVGAVFGSWQSDRAKVYRRLNSIPQTGARQSTSRRWCSKHGRDPRRPESPSPRSLQGRPCLLGEYLINAQARTSSPVSAPRNI
jgi:pyruvate,orthophosphate dikinase